MIDLERLRQLVEISNSVPARAIDDKSIAEHPFDTRNIHDDIPARARELFDDGYYSEATFEAFKFIDREVARISGQHLSGFPLMMKAFDENCPLIPLTACSDLSEVDEQRGYRHMFAGAQVALRNPRGHGTDLSDTPDTCLDHLSIASVLLRRLDGAGLRPK